MRPGLSCTSPKLALLGLLLLVLVVGGAVLLSRSELRGGAWPEPLRIATASPGGTYTVIGSGLAARVLGRAPSPRLPHVIAEESRGSGENIERLVRGDTELALVSSAALRAVSEETRSKMRALACLYDGYMQLVVRKDAGIETVADLAGRRVYVGKRKSGTELIAAEILATAGLDPDAWQRVGEEDAFDAAARRLLQDGGGIDAAIFGGGIPTQAVSRVLASGRCRLLDLGDVATQTARRVDGLVETSIGREFYRGQKVEVRTVAAPALLVGRADLPSALVEHVLDLLFDNIDKLLAYALAQPGRPGVVAIETIRVEPDHAFPCAPLPYHPGSLRFQERERGKLLIATGSLGGRYHQLGLQIQRLLEQAGLPARAIHTAGSFQNADLLRTSSRPAIAIMQYDAALATLWGEPDFVYRPVETPGPSRDEDEARPALPGLRSIARLHEERMHVLAREKILEGLPDGVAPTVACLQGLRVCLGPRGSATQELAQAILEHHGVTANTVWLSFRDMQLRLDPPEEGIEPDLDAGFFCGGRPSLALRDLLRADSRIRLLAVEPDALVELTLAASLEEVRFTPDEDGAYGCVDGPIPTIATRAILVTTEDNPHVRTVTRAVFQGAGMLPGLAEDGEGLAGIEQSMAAPLATLQSHPDAVAVYEERGLRLVPETRLIETLAGALGIVAILVGAYRGAQFLRQDQLAERIRGKVLEVSLDAATLDSARRLTHVRDEVRSRAQRPWWSAGALSKKRWQELETMIEERVAQARSTLCAALLGEARVLRRVEGAEAAEARDELHGRIWQHAQDGELSELQVLLALRALGVSANELHAEPPLATRRPQE